MEKGREKEEIRRGTDDNETMLRGKKVCCGSRNGTSLRAWSSKKVPRMERNQEEAEKEEEEEEEKEEYKRGSGDYTSLERRSGRRVVGTGGGSLSVVRIKKKF
ncbi:hypothetical protein TWF173_006620 [Orbilia oligospora]|nr:hypothetical protein TWF173_006620 [Orbilia oligospora]